MFERFDSRYDLRGRLITKTALHIGAGGSLAVVGSDNPVVRDVNGLPYIPGSSFKGSLRSLVEGIVRALSPGDRQEPWACDPLNSPCVRATDLEGLSDDEISQIVEHGTNNGGEACTVCRLFGSPWLASKVKVADLYLTEGTNWRARVEVRDGVAIDRDTETVSGRRKYDFEVVPRETAFDLHLRVDNASDEELGLLFLGLREFTNGGAWVGGNTSRGLGLVRIAWDEFEVVEGRAGLLAYLQSGKGAERKGNDITTFIGEKSQAFLRPLTEGGSEDVEETAQPGND
jgi:CRISPR-associated RAMP protein (TIGR02581 family)